MFGEVPRNLMAQGDAGRRVVVEQNPFVWGPDGSPARAHPAEPEYRACLMPRLLSGAANASDSLGGCRSDVVATATSGSAQFRLRLGCSATLRRAIVAGI